MNYEKQYIAETEDKKPMPEDYPDDADDFEMAFALWLVGFNKWLSARLEKAEKENDNIIDVADKKQREYQTTLLRISLDVVESRGYKKYCKDVIKEGIKQLGRKSLLIWKQMSYEMEYIEGISAEECVEGNIDAMNG